MVYLRMGRRSRWLIAVFGAARPSTDDELRSMHPSRPSREAKWHRAMDALGASEAILPQDAGAMTGRVDLVRLSTIDLGPGADLAFR